MNKTLVAFSFDYLHGTSAGAASACATSAVCLYGRQGSGNSLVMDCRCFCNLQEAIDIIERRVIPTDSDADFATPRGAVACAAAAGAAVCFCVYDIFGGNSLFAELSPIVFIYLYYIVANGGRSGCGRPCKLLMLTKPEIFMSYFRLNAVAGARHAAPCAAGAPAEVCAAGRQKSFSITRGNALWNS